MKIKSLLAAVWLLAAASLQAAVLTATTAVHSQADEGSAVITYLKAGSTATPATDSMSSTPAGWMAIDLPSPYEAYVLSKDINKSLDVRPGAALHLLPNPDSGVIATIEAGDKVQITGVRGKWNRLSVSKPLIGYVRISSLPPVASAPAVTPSPVTPAPLPLHSPAPAVGTAQDTATPRMTQSGDLGDRSSSALPRVFEGKFVSTKRPFAPKRPYDFQVNDSAGVRFAYLDLSKLMVTASVEQYQDRQVAVFGVLSRMPGTKDLVIQVESLQLK